MPINSSNRVKIPANVIAFSEALWTTLSQCEDSVILGKDGRIRFTAEDFTKNIESKIHSNFINILKEREIRILQIENPPEGIKYSLPAYSVNPLRLFEEISLLSNKDESRIELNKSINIFLEEAQIKFSLGHSARLIQLWNKIAKHISGKKNLNSDSPKGFQKTCIAFYKSEIEPLNITQDWLDGFIFAARCIGLIRLSGKPGEVNIVYEGAMDVEYLISNLFGQRTRISGFDELFGGGLILGRKAFENDEGLANVQGRIIFIKGDFGAGKTTMALSLATSVAESGGLAWYCPLEQSISNIEETASSLGISKIESTSNIIYEMDELEKIVIARTANEKSGVLVYLGTEPTSLQTVLEDLDSSVKMTENVYRQKVFVIDPINSILDITNNSREEMRYRLNQKFQRYKENGINIIFCGESSFETTGKTDFIESIADTVISMKNESEALTYAKRQLRIDKSRGQREQRGWQPYSIKSPEGITVNPSSAAFAARLKNRKVRHLGGQTQRFGWDDLDNVLGLEAFVAGDVIVIEGDSGCFKTKIGSYFAKKIEGRLPRTEGSASSLVLAMGERVEILKELFQRQGFDKNILLPEHLEPGFINPGLVFRSVEDSLLEARLEMVDRVWVDNLWRWERLCPFIQADPTFGQTLIALFRKYHLTSLFTCRDINSSSNGLQRAVLDQANVRINIRRHEYRGKLIHLLRVTTTREMSHRSENFIIDFDGKDLALNNSGNLLQVSLTGGLESVRSTLFLHRETREQRLYNRYFKEVVQPIVGDNITLQGRDLTSKSFGHDASAVFTSDSLQIHQVDEHFVNRGSVNIESSKKARKQSERLSAHTIQGYFRNFSFLVVENSLTGEQYSKYLSTWSSICALGRKFQLEKKSEMVFFDFSRLSKESLNCIFLEILSEEVANVDGKSFKGDYARRISQCLQGDAEYQESLVSALENYMYLAGLGGPRPLIDVDDKNFNEESGSNQYYDLTHQKLPISLVSRQWYSTLNGYFRNLTRKGVSDKFKIISIPNKVSIAGDWYLGVPSFSAAKERAAEAVSKMCSDKEASLRMIQGIGLPFNSKICFGGGGISTEWFSIDEDTVKGAYDNVVYRSEINSYPLFTDNLSFNLFRLIGLKGSPALCKHECELAAQRIVADYRRCIH